MGFLILPLTTARHFWGETLPGHFTRGSCVFLKGCFEQKMVSGSTGGCVGILTTGHISLKPSLAGVYLIQWNCPKGAVT